MPRDTKVLRLEFVTLSLSPAETHRVANKGQPRRTEEKLGEQRRSEENRGEILWITGGELHGLRGCSQ
jgi:hypothetical protein